MTDAEYDDLARALERAAQREQPQVAATLRLAAAQLRDDGTAEQRLTQLLATVPIEHLVSVAHCCSIGARPQAIRQPVTPRRI
jgi:hypothetical protein